MKKHRVNTTISQEHYEILKESAKEYGTQQKVLEHALDNLKKDSTDKLSPQLELWMRIGKEIRNTIIFVQKDLGTLLFETIDFHRFQEYIQRGAPVKFGVEWYYNKPLEQCTLPEIVKYIMVLLDIQGGADTISCTENDELYQINYTHNMKINTSRVIKIMIESLLESYGAKYETDYSQRNVFFKIYK
jgi:hypothetical protein